MKTIRAQNERKIAYSEEELLDLRRFFKLLNTSFISNRNMLEKIVIFIHNSNYENGSSIILNKLKSGNILEQIVKKLNFNFINIKYLFEEYLERCKKMVNSKNVDILINDPFLIFRLYSNNYRIKKGIVTLLNEEEKKLLINCLSEVTESKIMREIAKFINNTDYAIDFTIELDPDIIFLVKEIIRHEALNYILEFVKFLYLNYTDLFPNDIFYKNILIIQKE